MYFLKGFDTLSAMSERDDGIMSRRTFLMGAVAAVATPVVAGLLNACGTPGEGDEIKSMDLVNCTVDKDGKYIKASGFTIASAPIPNEPNLIDLGVFKVGTDAQGDLGVRSLDDSKQIKNNAAEAMQYSPKDPTKHLRFDNGGVYYQASMYSGEEGNVIRVDASCDPLPGR